MFKQKIKRFFSITFRQLHMLCKERQIYLRSDNGIKCIYLRPWLQVSIFIFSITSFILLFILGLYIYFNLSAKEELLFAANTQMLEIRDTHNSEISTLINREASLKNRLLLNQNEYINRINKLRGEYQNLLHRHGQIEKILTDGNLKIKDLPEKFYLKSSFVDDGRELPMQLPPIYKLISDQYDKTSKFVIKTYGQADRPLRLLRKYLYRHKYKQSSMLDLIELKKDIQISTLRKFVNRFGIKLKSFAWINDAKRIARSDKEKNSGGPFIPASQFVNFANGRYDKEIDNQIARIIDKSEKLSLLRKEIRLMPISLPIRNSSISSNFGLRSDPIRRVKAMHAGIDFRAPYGRPVIAAADGIVVRSGYAGAYGRLIEIKHVNGIRTRYAHLSRLKVKVGNKVRRGQLIGNVGSTGRSTGPHLHYEVRVDGRVVNPKRFWQVKNVVF